MGKLKIKRVQTGIYFQEEVLEKTNAYIKYLNDYIKNVDKEEFKAKHGWYKDNIKLVDFTDRVVMQFLDRFNLLNASESPLIVENGAFKETGWSKNNELIYSVNFKQKLQFLSDMKDKRINCDEYFLPKEKNPFKILIPEEFTSDDLYIALENMFTTNYEGLMEISKLYSNRSKRGLYISENLKEDFFISTEYFIPEKLGGKSTLFNNIIKFWFIYFDIYSPQDFLPFFATNDMEINNIFDYNIFLQHKEIPFLNLVDNYLLDFEE